MGALGPKRHSPVKGAAFRSVRGLLRAEALSQLRKVRSKVGPAFPGPVLAEGIPRVPGPVMAEGFPQALGPVMAEGFPPGPAPGDGGRIPAGTPLPQGGARDVWNWMVS